MFLSVCPPETSRLHLHNHISIFHFNNKISTHFLYVFYPFEMQHNLNWSIHNKGVKTYASMNIPASAKHLTLVFLENKPLNSSQCKIEARPPAEHPDRSAWNPTFASIRHFNNHVTDDYGRPNVRAHKMSVSSQNHVYYITYGHFQSSADMEKWASCITGQNYIFGTSIR